jgi:hypothetical protein
MGPLEELFTTTPTAAITSAIADAASTVAVVEVVG